MRFVVQEKINVLISILKYFSVIEELPAEGERDTHKNVTLTILNGLQHLFFSSPRSHRT
jgi:hypothetical protein